MLKPGGNPAIVLSARELGLPFEAHEVHTSAVVRTDHLRTHKDEDHDEGAVERLARRG